jgi:hypothetical protein
MRTAVIAAALACAVAAVAGGGDTKAAPAARIVVDYPTEGAIFPPEIMPPVFEWRDSAKTATMWRIDVSFADGAPGIHTVSKGARPRVGEIDPDCVADTNELPRLTARQATAHTWTPDAATWEAIKKRSRSAAAAITITGVAGPGANESISRGRVRIRTSADPVGAPIFYRDVPLMPSELKKGVIKPLSAAAVPLIMWRIRNIGEPSGHVVMEDVPVCANCHSFSADGKTMGMDFDGLRNNKGRYMLVPVAQRMEIRDENIVQWSSAEGRLKGAIRVGFMSQVSPDGRYVATTVNPASMDAASSTEPPSNYYVANFKNYKFLQVFYPTRGILCWYSRETGVLRPLPGADDPRYVQMGGVWSPDGKYLVFARAEAKEANPEGAPMAQFANDPNELQIRYDLYRVPFNGGQGGVAEPIAGASANGMSNSFPKVSPDGCWIVYVRCRNGLLMRPDSELWIVPAAGGAARRMRCNTRLMNSWHSFSPNGRWLVFSSKSESPYTRMYLTHIDRNGIDSPAIRIDNATAANRAVNIPEFVNVAPDGIRNIGGPALEYFQLLNSAMYFQKRRRFDEAIVKWRKLLELSPDDEAAHQNLGMLLVYTGRRDEAAAHIQKAKELRLRRETTAK